LRTIIARVAALRFFPHEGKTLYEEMRRTGNLFFAGAAVLGEGDDLNPTGCEFGDPVVAPIGPWMIYMDGIQKSNRHWPLTMKRGSLELPPWYRRVV
jgi:hypothetical protein